jgi:hypothetical protein
MLEQMQKGRPPKMRGEGPQIKSRSPTLRALARVGPKALRFQALKKQVPWKLGVVWESTNNSILKKQLHSHILFSQTLPTPCRFIMEQFHIIHEFALDP